MGTGVVCPRSSTESLLLGFPGHSVLPLAQGAGEMVAVTRAPESNNGESDAFITVRSREHQQEAGLASEVAAIWGLSEAAV